MMAVAAAQKNREMFAIKKSYSIEVSRMNNNRNSFPSISWNIRDQKVQKDCSKRCTVIKSISFSKCSIVYSLAILIAPMFQAINLSNLNKS